MAAKRTRTPMSDEHKAALAEGRNQGRAVRRYLEALESHKPKRGRKRTAESIQKRLTRIDLEMERADDLQKAVKESESALAREKQRVAAEKETLGGEQRRLEQERARLVGDRDRLAGSLPRDLLALFRRIAQTRGGIAIAPVFIAPRKIDGKSMSSTTLNSTRSPGLMRRARKRLPT